MNAGAARLLLAAVGDANDAGTWSGIPYHMLAHGRALGLIDAGLPLEVAARHWGYRRFAWNAMRLITCGERGGYQFSDAFLDRLWKPAKLHPHDAILNTFPLYPSGLFTRHPGPKWFYIDQTLAQLVDTYGLARRIGRRIAADAMAREGMQYRSAAGVICQSQCAADDVMRRYRVPPGRVHVAIPGANMDRAALADWEARQCHRPEVSDAPLRLVFVGKEWQRKGLDRLLRALAIARKTVARLQLVVVGVERAALPSDLAQTLGVEWVGFIDKRRDMARFLDVVGACHVGCLLSRAEAGGIALREFCRLGLPTLAPRVGGAPEYVLPEATDLVAADAPDAEIAAILMRLAQDRDDLARRRRAAWSRRHEACWEKPLHAIHRLVFPGRMT